MPNLRSFLDLVDALQWLLDDMHDAGETHSAGGVLYDSVENAARVLKAAGGFPPFPLPAEKAVEPL